MTTNPKSSFTQRARSVISALLFIAAGLVVLGRMAIAMALGENDRIRGQCDPVVIPQFFDGVTPPALPPGWSSTTWVTSNAGLPAPPADSLPNAAFVDDPATISDKQLLSPIHLLQPTATLRGCLSATTSTCRMALMAACLRSALMMG